MRCSKTPEYLSRKLDRELPHRHREALREHLRGCSDCRELQAKMESDELNLKRVLTFSKPDLRQFVTRTMAHITEMEEPHGGDQPSRRRREANPRSLLFWSQAVGLAASILVVAYFALIHEPRLVNQIGDLENTITLLRASAGTEAEREADGARERDMRTVAPETLTPLGTTTPRHAAALGDGLAENGSAESEANDVAAALGAGTHEADGPAVDGAADPAQTLVDDLLAAIESEDFDEIERLSAILLQLQERTAAVTDLLVQSYREEDEPTKRARLLDVMGSFATEGAEDFLLEELATATDVQIRRALTRGMMEVMASGQDTSLLATDELRAILRNPNEDWEVRAYAAQALISDSKNRVDLDLLEEVQQTIQDTEEPRFRTEVLRSLASTFDFDESPEVVSRSVSAFLTRFVSNESDYNTVESILRGLESSPTPGRAVEILDNVEGIEQNSLRSRLRRAKEVLLSDRDQSVQKQ